MQETSLKKLFLEATQNANHMNQSTLCHLFIGTEGSKPEKCSVLSS